VLSEQACLVCGKPVGEGVGVAELRPGETFSALPGGDTFRESIPIERIRPVHDECWLQARGSDRRVRIAGDLYALAPFWSG
jgi:hypothetical protein